MSIKKNSRIIVTEYELEQTEDSVLNEDESKSEKFPFIAQNDLKKNAKRKYPKNNSICFNESYYKTIFNQRTKKKRFFLYIIVGIFFIILTHQMSLVSHPSRIYIVSGWEPNQTRNVSDYIFPDKNTIITDVNNICNETDENIFLLIIVSSSAENIDAR